MPIQISEISPDRINFEGKLTLKEIESVIQNPEIQYVQTSEPMSLEIYDTINETLLIQRPDIELRIYGFYSQVCNLSFLQHLKNVKRLSIDCIQGSKGIENISALQNLESLTIGVYDLENFDFLETLNHQKITDLSLMGTKSKRPNLSSLPKFKNLKSLSLEAQQKEIESISSLEKLEKLVLRSISIDNLDFVRNLSHLWSLDIKLGGIKNLAALSHKESLKYLELWQVQGLEDISVISTLINLQYLFLQSLPKIKTLPDFSKLKNLRRIYLENLKGLKTVEEIKTASALEELIHIMAQTMEPSQYEGILKMKNLKKAMVLFGSNKKNEAFVELLKQHHIDQYKYTDFKFI